MADRFTYKDLYDNPKVKTASAKGHLQGINVVASNFDAYAREKSFHTPDYNSAAQKRQAVYRNERNKAITIQSQKVLNGLGNDQSKRNVLEVLSDKADEKSLLPVELDALNKIQGIPSLAPNIFKGPGKTVRVTSSGVGANKGETLGGVFVEQRLDGTFEGEVNIKGITGSLKNINLDVNVVTEQAKAQAGIEMMEEELVGSQKNLATLDDIPKTAFDMGITAIAKGSAKSKVGKLEGRIQLQKDRIEKLSGRGAKQFLAMERLESILRSDEYAGKIGDGLNGWTIAGELISAVPKGISQGIQGATLLATSGFTERPSSTQLSPAEIGRTVVEVFQEKIDEPLAMFGSSRARFRSRAQDRIILGVLENAPQMLVGIKGATAVSGMVKEAADIAYDIAIKKAVKKAAVKAGGRVVSEEAVEKLAGKAVKQISKNRQKVFSAVDKALTPLLVTAPFSVQEAFGTMSEGLAEIEKQLGAFDDVESIERVAEQLRTTARETGDKDLEKQADDLDERSSAIREIEGNITKAGGASFVTSAALEFIPFARTLKRGRVSSEAIFRKVETDKMRSVFKAGAKMVGGDIGLGIFEESGTEVAQQGISNLIVKKLLNENKDVFEGLGDAAAIAAIVGGVSNAVVSGGNISSQLEQVEILRRQRDAGEEVKRMAGELLSQDIETKKFFFSDRKDASEQFDTAEEAIAFAPVRHKSRLMIQYDQFLRSKENTDQEVADLLSVMSVNVEAAARSSNINAEEIYSQIDFEDLSQIPDLTEAGSLEPVINEATGKLEARDTQAQIDDALPPLQQDIDDDRGAEINASLKETQFMLTLPGLNSNEKTSLRKREDKLLEAQSETTRINSILNADVTPEEVTKLKTERARLQSLLFKGVPDPVEISNEDRLAAIENLLKTNVLDADERAQLENEKLELQDEQQILNPVISEAPKLGEEDDATKKSRNREQRKKSRVEFNDKKLAKRRENARKRILEKEQTKEKRERGKVAKARKKGNVLFQGGARGSIETIEDQGRVLIQAFQGADGSTLIHEMTHALQLLKNSDGVSLFDAVIGEDKVGKKFWEWATDNGENDRNSVAAREKMAGGFEVYLSNGEAPFTEFEPLFGRLAKIFKDIYKGLKNLPGVKLTKSAEKGFAKLFDDFATDTVDPVTGIMDVGAVSIFANDERLYQSNIPPGEIPPDDAKLEKISTPIVTNSDGTTEGVGPTDSRTFLTGSGKRAENKLNKLKKLESRKGVRRLLHNAVNAVTRGSLETTQGSLPQSAFEAKARREGLTDLVQAQTIQMSRKFNQALDLATGFKRNLNKVERKNRAILERKINDYLKEDDRGTQSRLLDKLPPEVRPVVQEMRFSIDRLSRQLINAGVVKGKMKMVFEDNLGSYINRSYQIHSLGAAWEDHVNKNEAEIINAAKQSFGRIFGAKTGIEQTNLLNAFLNPANHAGGLVQFFKNGSGLTVKQKGILKHRNNDIPPEWRALWGEQSDPMRNYANTVIKQVELLSSHQMVTEMKDRGLSEGWIAHKDNLQRDTAIDTEIRPDGAKLLDPLADHMTTREIARALEQAFRTDNKPAAWLQTLIKVNQTAKLTKTVGSLGTHVRNFMGSGVMYFGNGNLDLTNVLKGAGVAGLQAFGRGGYTSQTLFNEMTELSVIDQNLVVAEFDSVFSEAISSNGMNEFSEGFYRKLKKGVKKGTKKGLDIYQAGDTIWKAADYLSNLDTLIEAHQGAIPIGELKRMAAARTRATMPTYSLVPAGIKALSKFPGAGVFVSFTSESIRITANQLKLSIQDIKSGNDVLRKSGYRRLAGLVGSRLAFLGLSKASMAWSGIGKEEDKELRELLPPWDKNGDLIYIGRNQETGEPIYMNTQYLNPYSWGSQTFNALLKITPENAFSGRAKDNGLLGAGVEALGPFLGEEIGFAQILKVAFGSADAIRGDQFFKDMFDVSLEASLEVAIPSTIPQMKRLVSAFQGEQPLSGPQTSLAFLVGMTPVQADFEKSIGFKARDVKARLNRVGKDFVKDLNTIDPVDAVNRANARRERIYDSATRMVDAGFTWGQRQSEMEDILKGDGLSLTDIKAIMGGQTATISLTAEQAIKAERQNPGFIRRVSGIVDIRRGKKRISASKLIREARK